jgi:hypothetical protein
LSLIRGAVTSTAPAEVSTCRARARPRAAVAHHQPPAVFVELLGVRGDVRGDLGLQGGGEHPASAVTDDLVDQRPARPRRLGQHRWRGLIRVDYGEHGRTFPTRVGARALLDSLDFGLAGRGTPPRRSSTGFEHCSSKSVYPTSARSSLSDSRSSRSSSAQPFALTCASNELPRVIANCDWPNFGGKPSRVANLSLSTPAASKTPRRAQSGLLVSAAVVRALCRFAGTWPRIRSRCDSG